MTAVRPASGFLGGASCGQAKFKCAAFETSAPFTLATAHTFQVDGISCLILTVACHHRNQTDKLHPNGAGHWPEGTTLSQTFLEAELVDRKWRTQLVKKAPLAVTVAAGA
ncbi:hypothetical protein OH77DRAFT_1430849 [Trametes cingulata]|nr:hypothetical protein OH77DRAFT_1430849 [Trametes cingulata]